MKLLVKILLSCVWCIVVQSCSGDTYLNVGDEEGKKELVFSKNQSFSNLTINSNKDWSITSSGEWCKYNLGSGARTNVIAIHVDENYTKQDRECVLTVKAEDKTETVRVVQHGY
ncbi:MAG: BACON domain-containing protein [Tannerellaceae bacterium]|jgi:hypothetical protein|nr:BACON domain-containing protein [Tannerellaceae bacterium]